LRRITTAAQMNAFTASMDLAVSGAWVSRPAAEERERDYRYVCVETLIAVERILEDQPDNAPLRDLHAFLNRNMRVLNESLQSAAKAAVDGC
jgi:hypothetical protein